MYAGPFNNWLSCNVQYIILSPGSQFLSLNVQFFFFYFFPPTAGSALFLTLSDEVQNLGCAAIFLSGSSVLKAASKCAKVQFYFLFISCFLIGKWEQLCPGNKSRLFAYCVVIGLCIDGLAKSRCISVVIGYAN